MVPKNSKEYISIIENLIEEIAYGNKNALSDLYNYTKSDVYSFALSILKNSHEAEDVLHDVYIKIYDNAISYESNNKPLSWILTITKNISLMKIRKNKKHSDIDELYDVLCDNKNQNEAENKLLISTIFEYISEEERNILMLHSVSGFKHREISKILGIPLATVLSKYNRAIKKIQKRMGE